MSILKTSAGAITRAAAELFAGRLVAFPTETVYGLGADATNAEAVAGIYQLKGRPRFNPLIAHVANFAAAEQLVTFSPVSRRLAERAWPGPLTIVLDRRPDCAVADLASAGLPTLAVRVPDHPVALALLRAVGRPIVAPSANRSGRVSPTTAAHVAADFRGQNLTIIDGGPATGGLESTVVRVGPDAIWLLRPGMLARGDIEAVAGLPVVEFAGETGQILSPGQLASHYAPHAALRLNVLEPEPGEAYLAFGNLPPRHSGPVYNLSSRGSLIEAATRLFAGLRELDAAGVSVISVALIPQTGLGIAINDRLSRAAAPRS